MWQTIFAALTGGALLLGKTVIIDIASKMVGKIVESKLAKWFKKKVKRIKK